jgi:hypothetical protein
MDAMKRALFAFGSSCLLAAGAWTADAASPVVNPAAAQYQPPGVTAEDPELQLLLNQLTELSDYIGRNTESPQLWRYQLAQGEVLLQIAAHSKPGERDNWLRMAVDNFHTAAVLSPDNETTARDRLVQIANAFPGTTIATYAALREIRAEYQQALGKDGANPAKAQERLRDRLAVFAQEFPKAPEAPKAVEEAAQLSESLGQINDAKLCYRYLLEQSPDPTQARRAGQALARLGLAGEPFHLKLPLLFAASSAGQNTFDLAELRGKIVAVYFWSSAGAESAEDFRTLKQLTDRYQDRGVAVVYVNMDNDPARAKDFLSGRLTAGVHLYQPGGVDSPTAVRFGIEKLPQILLIGKDGVIIRNNLQASQLEAEVCSDVVRAR